MFQCPNNTFIATQYLLLSLSLHCKNGIEEWNHVAIYFDKLAAREYNKLAVHIKHSTTPLFINEIAKLSTFGDFNFNFSIRNVLFVVCF